MNPYRTYFMKVAALMALLLSLTFTNSAKAGDCGYSLSSNDQVWSFTTNAGNTQSRSLTITNTSGATLILDLSFTGSEAFSTEHSQITIGAGDTATIVIKFHPGSTASGTLSGKLTITKHETDCKRELGLSGIVSGTSANDAMVADPHEFSFGAIPADSTACRTVTVTNKSKTVVIITGYTRCDNNDFTVTPSFNNGDSIKPNASVTFTICYKPSTAHPSATCSVTLTYNTEDPKTDGNKTVISFGGSMKSSNTGSDAALVADPHEFKFGSVPLDSSVCRSVIVTNKSKVSVIITEWSKCESADFTITPATGGNDTLAAGSSMTFTICYKPDAEHAEASCNLTVRYIPLDGSTESKSLIISFGGSRAGSSNGGNTDLCLKSEQGDNTKDPVVIGGSADHTIYLINKSNFAITVNSAVLSGTNSSVFKITSSFPITVPAHSSNTTLSYTFAPTSNNSNSFVFTAAVLMSLSGDSLYCEKSEGHLVGVVVHSGSTTDSVVRPLFPSEKRTLGIESNGTKVNKPFYFTNNLGVDATVNKVYLADGTYFTISSMTPTPTPFVLHPGDNLTVIVSYTANDNMVHHDQLMIDADHQLQSTSFDLQGVQATAGVSNQVPAGVAINVSPNPASSFVNVNLTGVQIADVQIIDLLGNTIATAKANTTWKWNASNIVAGSYIVRIAGESIGGVQFVTSKRVVVSK